MIEKNKLGAGISFTLRGKKIRGIVCGERTHAQPQYFTVVHILDSSDARLIEKFCVGAGTRNDDDPEIYNVHNEGEIYSASSLVIDSKYWKDFIPYEEFESIKSNCFYVSLGNLTLWDEEDEVHNLIREIDFELGLVVDPSPIIID
mgnify:CR=1 FL=1